MHFSGKWRKRHQRGVFEYKLRQSLCKRFYLNEKVDGRCKLDSMKCESYEIRVEGNLGVK